MPWLLLFIAILCEALATSALKLAEGFTRPLPSIGVVIGYALSFYCFSLAIKTISIGIAYAVWCGIGIAIIVLVGWLYFGQALDAAAMAGVLLILAGVLIIYLFSNTINYE